MKHREVLDEMHQRCARYPVQKHLVSIKGRVQPMPENPNTAKQIRHAS